MRATQHWAGTITIQLTPNVSVTMPKHGDQKVLPSGMVTLPPLLSALNARWASASVGTESESENPAKFAPAWEIKIVC